MTPEIYIIPRLREGDEVAIAIDVEAIKKK
jgi:hypothetical protein